MDKKQTLLELGIIFFLFAGFIAAENIVLCLASFILCAVLVLIYIANEKKNGRW